MSIIFSVFLFVTDFILTRICHYLLHNLTSLCVRVAGTCVRIYDRAYKCVCVCVHVYLKVCAFVCVCVCASTCQYERVHANVSGRSYQ